MEVAKEFSYVQPEMSEESVIMIQDGRHPLLELIQTDCIPNSYVSGTEGRLKILTGPNGSGKTFYLKLVAIIVYLAHIGSFVPASKAIIGLSSGIFSKIQLSRLCADATVSSFLHSLRQVREKNPYFGFRRPALIPRCQGSRMSLAFLEF